MKRIKLVRRKFSSKPTEFVLVDDNAYAILKNYRWYASIGNGTYYAYTKVAWKKRGLPMHTLIMNPPKSLLVDHINGNGLDNRIKNLRIVSHGQNISFSVKRF